MASIKDLIRRRANDRYYYDAYYEDELIDIEEIEDDVIDELKALYPKVNKLDWDDPNGEKLFYQKVEEYQKYEQFKKEMKSLGEECKFSELRKVMDKHFDIEYPEWFDDMVWKFEDLEKPHENVTFGEGRKIPACEGIVSNIKIPEDRDSLLEIDSKEWISFNWKSEAFGREKEIVFGFTDGVWNKNQWRESVDINSILSIDREYEPSFHFLTNHEDFINRLACDIQNNDVSEWTDLQEFIDCGVARDVEYNPFLRQENFELAFDSETLQYEWDYALENLEEESTCEGTGGQ